MKQTTLMTHLVGGYPSMEECEQIAYVMADSGVSFIEIQIPFSDPVADGKTIMDANVKALENGTKVEDCFELMAKFKKRIEIPLLFMTYFNIPFVYGVEKFCKRAAEVGCYGLIVPDIPYDEEVYDHYLESCKKHGLHAIQVVSPITPERRLKKIGEVASGFVYCVSNLGTTGERKSLPEGLDEYLGRVRRHVRVPLALGFGIAEKGQVLEASAKADIVVIGSKILNLYGAAPEGKKLPAVKEFLETLELRGA